MKADDIARKLLSKQESENSRKCENALPTATSSSGSTRMDRSHSVDHHVDRVTDLFARMRSLYRHKANEMVTVIGGQPTLEFKLWCQKTAHLTDQQFAQGVAMMERQEMDARKTGDETWPPSYAGFIGLATMSTKPRSTVTALPAPTDKRLAAERLAQIREILH